MIKLSIIIPIYKVEKYIVECIESICCQLIDGVEVILINDGTPDNSMLMAYQYICEKYNYLLSQFVFIDQENQGQSVARNNALAIAQGCYVAFVDSDDKIINRYIETLLPLLDNDVDIIQFKSYRFCTRFEEEKRNFNVGIEIEGEFLSSNSLIKQVFNKAAWFPWLNVYKSELFKGKKFEKGIYFEDAVLIPDLFLDSKKIIFINDILYCYRVNYCGSLLSSSKNNISKLIFSYNEALNIHIENIKFNGLYSPVVISLLRNYIDFVYKKNGVIKSYIAYGQFKTKIYPYIQKCNLERGNLLFYKYGFSFFLLHKAFLNISGKMKEIVG
ncbi:MAG: glycosyltransferase [Clostridia bacterium]